MNGAFVVVELEVGVAKRVDDIEIRGAVDQ